MRGISHFRREIIGFILISCVTLSFYTLIVQAVQQFNNRPLIEQLSLFGSKVLDENRTQFQAGEILTIYAKVAAGDVYLATVYDQNGSVFSQNGKITDSKVVIQVPLDPPNFRAGKSYVVVFHASIPCYPILGASVNDMKIASFNICTAETRLGFICDYDEGFHKLSLNASLVNEEGIPVANKTVRFHLQLNTSSYIRDRGWLLIGSAKTSTDGSASFVMGCNLFSGTHYIKAEFEGDGDFGHSKNTTLFTVAAYRPFIQLSGITGLANEKEFVVKVTDVTGYPLTGKTVAIQNPASSKTVYATTNDEGKVSAKLTGSESSREETVKFVVLKDLFTSQSEFACSEADIAERCTFDATSKPSRKPTISQSGGNLEVSILSATPYAVLPTQVNATYVGWFEPGSAVDFVFVLDGVRELSRVSIVGRGEDVYSVLLRWCPDVIGAHWISVDVSSGSRYGALSAQDSVSFESIPCESNLQMYTPQVVYEAGASFSLVFTMPRVYEKPDGIGLFDSFNLAPDFVFENDTTGKIDQGIPSSVVQLYVNGSGPLDVFMNDDGVGCMNLTISMFGSHVSWNFTAVVNETLFESQVVQRTISYSKVHVNDGADAREYLALGCVVGEGNVTTSEVYVCAESSVEARASLFDLPMWNVPVNFTFAEFIPPSSNLPWIKTGSGSHTLNVPDGADFLRAVYVYDNASLDGDINYRLMKSDNWRVYIEWSGTGTLGRVSIADIGIITTNWGKPVTPSNANADINHDGQINIQDSGVITANWQRQVNYLSSYGAYADFDVDEDAALDSGGCVKVPAGATTVTIRSGGGLAVGAFVEFFNVTDEKNLLRTDTSGAAKTSWVPGAAGDYLVETELRSQFHATVSQNTSITSVSESVCMVKYVNVTKRSVTLDLIPDEPLSYEEMYPIDIPVSADAVAYEYEPEKYYGQRNFLAVCTWASNNLGDYMHGGKGWTFLNFNSYTYFKDAYVNSATLTLYVNGSGYGREEEAVRNYDVYWVCEPWSETDICWDNMPSYGGLCAEQTVDLRDYPTEITWDLTDAFNNPGYDPSASFIYGLMIRDRDENSSPEHIHWCEFYSHESSGPSAVLHVEFSVPRNVAVYACDPLLDEPATALQVYWSVNGTGQGWVWTDEYGYATLPLGDPYDGSVLGVFNVTAVSSTGDLDYASAEGSWIYDNRWLSNVTCTQGNTTGAYVNVQKTLNFHFTSAELYNKRLNGMSVRFFINDVQNGSGTTNYNGSINFSRTFASAGTYVVTACLEGTRVFSPCNFSVCVTAQVLPVAIDFSVSPEQFVPNSGLRLTAKVINLNTSQPLGGYNVEFRRVNSASVDVSVETRVTNGSGVAFLDVTYPSGGDAYAYYARAVYTAGNPQNIASNPVQLTVGSNTTLLLTLDREESSNTHTLTCRLVNHSRNGLDGKPIKLKLNDDEKETKTTTGGGFCTWTLNLSPQSNNSATTYNIAVSFEGDPNPKTAIAHLTTPNGTQYDVCTTIQYTNYKPSTNSTSLYTLPQTTTGETTLKSPEQMQKEAQASGGLNVYPEFSWWYPWFRLHFAWKSNGQTMLDVGIALLPFGDTAYFPDTPIKGKVNEWFWRIAFNVFIGLIATEFALWAGSNLGLLYFGIILGFYYGYKLVSLYSSWGSVEGLCVSLVSAFVSTAYSAWRGLCSFLPSSLQALAAGAESIKNVAFAFLCKLITIPINIILLMMTWNRIVELGGV